jgi:hypothetical protein
MRRFTDASLCGNSETLKINEFSSTLSNLERRAKPRCA